LCIGDLKHLDGWFAGKFLQDILESCGWGDEITNEVLKAIN
jgi:hypothetical protein